MLSKLQLLHSGLLELNFDECQIKKKSNVYVYLRNYTYKFIFLNLNNVINIIR